MEFYINILKDNNETVIFKTFDINELKEIIKIGLYNINCPDKVIIKEKINDKYYDMLYTYLNIDSIHKYLEIKNNKKVLQK